jgi:hypothetical protein
MTNSITVSVSEWLWSMNLDGIILNNMSLILLIYNFNLLKDNINPLWEWVVEQRVKLFVSWELLGLKAESCKIWFAPLLQGSVAATLVNVFRLQWILDRPHDHPWGGDELKSYVQQGSEIMLNNLSVRILFSTLNDMFVLYKYSRNPHFRNNWDFELSGYTKNTDNSVFLWK